MSLYAVTITYNGSGVVSINDSVQMDVVESNASHQESDEKHNEGAPQKAPSNMETNSSTKESPKSNSKQKRGRSRTPQKKTEDPKTLHVTLKKLESELNGKETPEEPEKKEENGNKNETNQTNEEKTVKEDRKNVEEEVVNKNKQSQKQKDEKSKKEVNKKLNNQEKKESPKKGDSSKKESTRKDKKEKGKKEPAGQTNEPDTEPVEMDPLVISDEPDPELQFDENSDIESGKGSPVISRCVTRRSQTRNIPTPKTPKSVDQDVDSEKNSAAPTPITDVADNDIDLPKTDNYDSGESMDTENVSTKPEVGSDLTRMDFIQHHDSEFEDSSYINASREKSLSETLRGLSARRSIRPLDDYRMRLLRSNQERSDLNLPYPSRSSVEQVTTGVKRKGRSVTPEETKKFKVDSPGTNSLFSSPFVNIRNKFKSELPSSTPKLLSYRDRRQMLYNEDDFENGDDEKKSWCSVM